MSCNIIPQIQILTAAMKRGANMDLLTSINQVLILFIIMFIGAISKRTGIITKEIQNSISAILMKIALPAMVIASSGIERADEVLPNMLQIFVITVASYIFIIIGTTMFTKIMGYESARSNVFISLVVFANVGFMGYPVVRAFFGEMGVFYASIPNLVFSVLQWTYGVLLFNSNKRLDLKKLLNPGTISSFIAVFLFLLNMRLPSPLQSALNLIGQTAAPMSMLLIGALIGEISITKLFAEKSIYLLCAVRLVLVPTVTALALKALGTNSIVTSICTLMAAMPSGATVAIFANEFDSEELFASIGVFMTSFLSVFSLPLIVYILTRFIL